MNADILAMLGGAGAASAASNRRDEAKPILSFKAGKMTAAIQSNGKYLVSPDQRRGTISLSWQPSSSSSSSTSSSSSNAGMLKFEWTDRRTRTTVDSHTIFPEDNVTYTKVDTGRQKDRVYLLQYGTNTDRLFFYWIQDKEEGNEDEHNCVKINMYAVDPNEARSAANVGTTDSSIGTGSTGDDEGESASGASSATSNRTGSRSGGLNMSGLGGGGLDNAALMQIMQGLDTTIPTAGGSDNDNVVSSAVGGNNTGSGGAHGQVDALSNILENLGMPQPSTATAATPVEPVTTLTPETPASNLTANNASTGTSTPSVAAQNNRNNNSKRSSGGLTLSDLQGAMATLATTSPTPAAASATPLDQVVTPEAVLSSGILNDPAVKSRLITLLPETQRTEERLMDNLRSPQLVQCLKSLTAAICEDGALNSILINFQLLPSDGETEMMRGNPIQAFLECVLKSVEREKEKKEKNDDGDTEMSG